MDVGLTADDDEQLMTLLAEYRQIIGKARKKYYSSVNILYPTMSLLQPEESEDEESSDDSMSEVDQYAICTYIDEVRRRLSMLHIICINVQSSTFPNTSFSITNGSRA